MSKEELSEYWEEYCNVLYNELKNPQIRNLDKSYKIWARVKKLKFSRNLTLWEIKIENLQKMREDCMRTQIWKKETAFIEKLNMDLPRKNAIMKYLNKMNGVEEEEISKEGIKAAHKIIGRSSASGGGVRASLNKLFYPLSPTLQCQKMNLIFTFLLDSIFLRWFLYVLLCIFVLSQLDPIFSLVDLRKNLVSKRKNLGLTERDQQRQSGELTRMVMETSQGPKVRPRCSISAKIKRETL